MRRAATEAQRRRSREVLPRMKQKAMPVRVGIEATGHTRWFERLLAGVELELWIGDPAKTRAQRVRKQKTDRQDAQHLLTLLLEDRFPRWGVPGPRTRVGGQRR